MWNLSKISKVEKWKNFLIRPIFGINSVWNHSSSFEDKLNFENNIILVRILSTVGGNSIRKRKIEWKNLIISQNLV